MILRTPYILRSQFFPSCYNFSSEFLWRSFFCNLIPQNCFWKKRKKCYLSLLEVSYYKNCNWQTFCLEKLPRYVYFQVHRSSNLKYDQTKFVSLRGVTLQNNYTKKFLTKSCTNWQKNGFEGCVVFSESSFKTFTGQFPVKN